ncbi:MAG: hypothetical protein QOH10_2477 [Actinomycetota bacterium]|nr:hypothetical protein [Actinomycetota bacterium]
MSLQGTLDTLSVTELFALLSTAGKTGALRLEAGEHEASVFVSAGRCCAVESDEATGPVGSEEDLARRLVDVGFSLARPRSGSFRFSDSEAAELDATLTIALEPAVAEITAMLDQWAEIEQTIPSLDVRVRLAPVLRDDELVVSAQEWGLLVALEGMPSVREVVARRGETVIEVCRALKGLADRGAIEVGTTFAGMDTRADLTDRAVGRGHRGEAPGSMAIDPLEPYAPVATDGGAETDDERDTAAEPVSRPARARRPVPDVFAAVEELSARADAPPAEAGGDSASTGNDSPDVDPASAEDETSPGDTTQDRGALLRLFSALKDS